MTQLLSYDEQIYLLYYWMRTDLTRLARVKSRVELEQEVTQALKDEWDITDAPVQKDIVRLFCEQSPWDGLPDFPPLPANALRGEHFQTKTFAGRTAYKTEFYIDDPDTVHYAGYSFGLQWNGWACPYFPKASADQLVANLIAEADENEAGYSAERDVYWFRNPNEGEADEYGALDIQTPDGPQHVYPIGAGSWIWDEDDNKTERRGSTLVQN